MDRRTFLRNVGVLSAVGLSGCTSSSSDHGYSECYGNCSKVQNIAIDSHGGWGSTYTDITLIFEQSYTGTIAVETYNIDNEINGYKEVEVEDVRAYTVSFDRFKTSKRYKIYLKS